MVGLRFNVLLIAILESSTVQTHRKSMEQFVIGGEDANIDIAPHSVFLVVDDNDDSWSCGGSVLNQRLVVTAAHCLDTCFRNCNIDAIAGHANYKKAIAIRKIQKYVQHKWFSRISGNNDVAILLTSDDIPLCQTIQRVIIQPSFVSTTARVFGWGITEDRAKKHSLTLKTVAQKLIPRSECAKCQEAKLHPGKMCAYSGSKHHHPASGDSGGALITSEHQQIGIVSTACQARRDVIIYSNISYYYTWIVEQSEALYCLGKTTEAATTTTTTGKPDFFL